MTFYAAFAAGLAVIVVTCLAICLIDGHRDEQRRRADRAYAALSPRSWPSPPDHRCTEQVYDRTIDERFDEITKDIA